jgi:nucleotide-binding universal stress UspA family protein
MTELRRILVPVDFSACSRAALDEALFLARHFGASIDVLHVVDPPYYFVVPDAPLAIAGTAPETLTEHARALDADKMEMFLSQWAAQATPRDVHIRSRLEVGDPCTAILKVAHDERFDLLVMGRHGRSGLIHLLMGSVAEKVVRRAPCPVLTTHGAPHVAPTDEPSPVERASARPA